MSMALYRRYRPQQFQDVIGQEHVTRPLMAALRAEKTAHAYLFSGPRGCGKTTSARILARCLNCVQYPTDTPCGECESCRELSLSGSGSLDVVEMDAASHGGVDDARDLIERASFAPARDRYKIFIIDEAHMVSNQGFNALLKLVEEPPPHVKFIFATTEPDKVIGTIRSRTHHYPFRLVPPEILDGFLHQVAADEGIEVGPGVIPLVVRAGGGSVRDSLSVLDQLIGGTDTGILEYDNAIGLLGYTDGSILDDAVEAIAASDGVSLFAVVERIVQSGHDPRRFVEDLLQRLRDVILIALAGDQASDVFTSVPQDQFQRMSAQAEHLGAVRASHSADLVNSALSQMVGATSPRLQLELLCARLLVPTSTGSATVAAPAGAAPSRQSAPTGNSAPRAPRQRPAAAIAKGTTAPAQPAPTARREISPAWAAHSGTPTQAAATRAAENHNPEYTQPSDTVSSQPQPQHQAKPAPAVQPETHNAPVRPSPTPQDEHRNNAPTEVAQEQIKAPSQPAPTAPEHTSIDELRRNWHEILTSKKRHGLSVRGYAQAVTATPVALEGTTLTIGFPANKPDLVERFTSQGHAEELARALADIITPGLTVNVIAGDVLPKADAAQEAAPSQRPSTPTPITPTQPARHSAHGTQPANTGTPTHAESATAPASQRDTAADREGANAGQQATPAEQQPEPEPAPFDNYPPFDEFGDEPEPPEYAIPEPEWARSSSSKPAQAPMAAPAPESASAPAPAAAPTPEEHVAESREHTAPPREAVPVPHIAPPSPTSAASAAEPSDTADPAGVLAQLIDTPSNTGGPTRELHAHTTPPAASQPTPPELSDRKPAVSPSEASPTQPQAHEPVESSTPRRVQAPEGSIASPTPATPPVPFYKQNMPPVPSFASMSQAGRTPAAQGGSLAERIRATHGSGAPRRPIPAPQPSQGFTSEEDEVSADDPTIEQSNLVGIDVVLETFGGTVIEEIAEERNGI
ncbi:DNA polymerase III subunit gamma and tau [Arcanobacterium haemolyticum]|nr:DNA polymerase III subunit gamma and tau [Arcanobacterium haemolyticum]